MKRLCKGSRISDSKRNNATACPAILLPHVRVYQQEYKYRHPLSFFCIKAPFLAINLFSLYEEYHVSFLGDQKGTTSVIISCAQDLRSHKDLGKHTNISAFFRPFEIANTTQHVLCSNTACINRMTAGSCTTSTFETAQVIVNVSCSKLQVSKILR
jgi:hypothetical protein